MNIFKDKLYHIIGVSETWLKQSSKSVELNGYKILRCERPRIRGGGVALSLETTLIKHIGL